MVTAAKPRLVPDDVELPADEPEELTPEEIAAREKAALDAAVVELHWKGQVFTMPKRRGRWPVGAAREFGRQNHLEALVGLIGEADYERLEALCPFVDDINEFAEYMGERINAECIP